MQTFNTKRELRTPAQAQLNDWGQQGTLKRKTTHRKGLNKEGRRGENGEVEHQWEGITEAKGGKGRMERTGRKESEEEEDKGKAQEQEESKSEKREQEDRKKGGEGSARHTFPLLARPP